ncbi:MAG: hypothetical protein ACAI25_14300 [Planctomycetota bacterium]
MRALHLLGALAVSTTLLAALGCEKERTTITVFPDGSGKIEIKDTLGKQISSFALMMAEGDEKKQEVAAQTIHKKLATWEGVCAWSEVKAAVTDAEEISGSAVGYFEDISKLKRADETSLHEFKWTKNADGGFTIEETQSDKKKDEDAPKKDPADSFLKKMPDEQLDMAVTMTTSMLEGLQIDRVIVMPGDVTEIAGAQKKEGRKATMTISDKELAELIKKSYKRGAELRKKIDDGETTEEKAKAELNAEFKDVMKSLKATCKAGDVTAEHKENKTALEAAKKAYAGSATEKKVKEAKENKPKMPGGGKHEEDE